MAQRKTKSIYTCSNCGYQSPKWMGKCPDCQQWNTLVEETVPSSKGKTHRIGESHAKPLRLKEIASQDEPRKQCGISELDRVLGGGIVAGSFTLIGGDPGIGKSTLLLQAIDQLSRNGKTLYVTGEESCLQVKLRAERLGVNPEHLFLLAETALETIFDKVRDVQPDFLIIDSIQTMFTTQIESAPGSVSQVRECAGQLMQQAKNSNLPTFIVGHVTKDGSIAGPRVLEHMVDTVLYFEGDPGHPYRILRAVKNRFGSTNEIGVFQMSDCGLREVKNPSEIFLAERPEDAPGSVVIPSVEGSRPILVELQALVSSAPYGTARRTAMGIDHNRVSLLVAVLEKKVGMSLLSHDIFVNVAGGVKIDEPAADLAILAALASSHLNKSVPRRTVVFGEIGLAGEIRAVSQPELRIKEAARLGFERCLLPTSNSKNLETPSGITLCPVATAQDALDQLFDH
ncbi:DNA repair protein RadA [Desulfuromonas acetoxidans]|uniref:DNA repair protein RadA n=1 Tax=Desulfuromonas acetoxidans TaxID=891 RepID=UPI0015937135|nr:DNA repair protein RadA [Desulfuromonas acetoxidans]MBF0645815.1 DNA repair protein RadA [Desulfuromonas acetoxidans]NVD24797.1 DNA repair protein RadA [Desulfuromonas acetoxidans]NVE16842.1 DNA repair protein RadA [Desulfuromonas acetoxidans]